MPDALYREFLLTGEGPARALQAFLKANARSCAESQRPLRVIVTEDEHDRLDQQIAYYFGVVIKAISEQAWVEGRRYSKRAWHEEMAKKFLPEVEIELPSGEIIVKRASIARGHIGVRAMAKFINEVQAYAAAELGVEIPA
ncbi:recombinase [Bordetella bronchialis]|uniref:recombination protein NinB n=1 Tax=Bordetella bronchialis TaxID=463025 RepID=UPI003D01BC14